MIKSICKNCTFYSAYYKQYSSGFGKIDHGYCSKQQQPISQHETCENFKSNEAKEKSREERRLVALDQALESINEIAQILKEKMS